jgi:hypothetical protein
MSLQINSECGLSTIYDALHECEKLRRVAVSCSDQKRVFTDYGKPVTYACVGPQPSRNSKNTVQDNPPFMDSLPKRHWRSLLWLMKRVEMSFRALADHAVISHIYHAKKLVLSRPSSLPEICPLLFHLIFLMGLHLVQMYIFVVTLMLILQ